MFKKLVILLLIPAFLFTTGGIVLNTHFCKMRGSADVSIIFNLQKSCCGGEAMESNCCKNELKVFKIKDDYSSPAKLNLENDLFPLIPFLSFQLKAPILTSIELVSDYRPPPPDTHVPLFVIHCSILV